MHPFHDVPNMSAYRVDLVCQSVRAHCSTSELMDGFRWNLVCHYAIGPALESYFLTNLEQACVFLQLVAADTAPVSWSCMISFKVVSNVPTECYMTS
jgi:hypothetical protein